MGLRTRSGPVTHIYPWSLELSLVQMLTTKSKMKYMRNEAGHARALTKQNEGTDPENIKPILPQVVQLRKSGTVWVWAPPCFYPKFNTTAYHVASESEKTRAVGMVQPNRHEEEKAHHRTRVMC